MEDREQQLDVLRVPGARLPVDELLNPGADLQVAGFPWLGVLRYLAYSTARDSRMTVTLICPGYSSWPSISRAISCDRSTAASSSISDGLTMTLISRPAWRA